MPDQLSPISVRGKLVNALKKKITGAASNQEEINMGWKKLTKLASHMNMPSSEGLQAR